MNIEVTSKNQARLFLALLVIGVGLSFVGVGLILISANFAGIVEVIVFLVGILSILAQLRMVGLVSGAILTEERTT